MPTRALLAQWLAALAAVYDGPIGRFGDGERVLAPLTVATFAGAYRHMARIGDRFGLLIVDEAHHFGHGAAGRGARDVDRAAPPRAHRDAARARIRRHAPRRRWSGRWCSSARSPISPGRTSRRSSGSPGTSRSTPEERREYDALRAVYRRAWDAYLGNHLNARWEDFLRHASQTDDGRRGVAAWRRARRLLAFPRRKREALAGLLARHRQERTLIFVADNETAYTVAREHLVMPLTCDIGRRERDEALARFRAGELRALVSAQVLNEGLDVPDAAVGIVVAGRMGAREHVQRVGRLLRPGAGKRALVYELVVGHSSEAWQAERRGRRLAGAGRSAA